MQPLVASALDSKERFDGRKLWPAYAKWLRPVGPSAPVAAALIGGKQGQERQHYALSIDTQLSSVATDETAMLLSLLTTFMITCSVTQEASNCCKPCAELTKPIAQPELTMFDLD